MTAARWAQRRREIEKEMHDRKCQRLPLLLRFIEYCIKFRCLKFLDLGTWRWVVYWSLVKTDTPEEHVMAVARGLRKTRERVEQEAQPQQTKRRIYYE